MSRLIRYGLNREKHASTPQAFTINSDTSIADISAISHFNTSPPGIFLQIINEFYPILCHNKGWFSVLSIRGLNNIGVEENRFISSGCFRVGAGLDRVFTGQQLRASGIITKNLWHH